MSEQVSNLPAHKEQGDLAARLAAPFPADVVEWKAQATAGNRALAVAYIDARAVMDRLDEVVGPAHWQDTYEFLADGSCLCQLSLRVGGEWITKQDVGGQSDQPDPGDRHKAAVSDALKRAAVKWSVGRYLYSLPATWVDYDPQKKQLVGKPALPGWATPAKKPPEDPKTGEELFDRMAANEAALVERGLCKPGDLVRHVREELRKAGFPMDVLDLPPDAIALAVAA